MASKKTYINIANKYDRIIVLVDMDCFYCQVEEKLNPSLAGKPIAVVQYNTWQGGGIIAVNYPARAQGVTRHMRGDEAKEQCPEITLVSVPSIREKADLTKYREAGKEVAIVLQSFTSLLERASVDEAYLDITENVKKRLDEMDKNLFNLKPDKLANTFVIGYNSVGDYIDELSLKLETNSEDIDFEFEDTDLPAIKASCLKLLVGASIVNEIRAMVKEKTGYECSAGIAHNKILAKLACGMNKPNKQTILPLRQVKPLFSTLPVGKVKGLGGKLGEDVCEKLKIKYIGDLQNYSENELQRKFDEKIGSWLYLICRGIELEAVTPRFSSKSIGCCKKFPGKNAISGINTLNHWLTELSNEICDRMQKDEIENNRKAKHMVISYIQEINGNDVSSSRSTNIISYDSESMAKNALDVLKKNTDQFFKTGSDHVLNNSIKFLGISVGKFESSETKQNTLQQMFLNQAKKKETGLSMNTCCEQEIPKADQKVSNPKEDTKSTIKSFFANHLKKSNISSVDPVESETKTETKKEVESFFLNVLKGSKTVGEQESKNESENKSETESNSSEETFDEVKINNKSKSEQKIKSVLLNFQESQNDVSERITNTECEMDSAKINPQVPDEDNIFEDEKDLFDQENIEPYQSKPNPRDIPSTSKEHFQNESHTSTYMKEYAEFGIPEISENDYMNCEKCGKKILSYTFQTHMDFHFALELSKEQRESYRKEIKAKMKSPPAVQPTKKLKTKEGKTAKVSKKEVMKENILEKFLIKGNSLKSPVITDLTQKQLCLECGEHIEIKNLSEHKDYHAAKRLQHEMDQSSIQLSLHSNTVSTGEINKEKDTSK